jgi:hypothetical protein
MSAKLASTTVPARFRARPRHPLRGPGGGERRGLARWPLDPASGADAPAPVVRRDDGSRTPPHGDAVLRRNARKTAMRVPADAGGGTAITRSAHGAPRVGRRAGAASARSRGGV